MGWIPRPCVETATRGSRAMFFSLRKWRRLAITISSPSSPVHAIVTCGLPSGFNVTRWARWSDSITARAEGVSTGTSSLPLSGDQLPGAAELVLERRFRVLGAVVLEYGWTRLRLWQVRDGGRRH